MTRCLTATSLHADLQDAASQNCGVILAWQEVAALALLLQYVGHRFEGEHDCFTAMCHDLGPEVERLRKPQPLDVDRLATALSIVMSDMDSTPGPSGSYQLGEGTSYWRDRAVAVAQHYANRTQYKDITS